MNSYRFTIALLLSFSLLLNAGASEKWDSPANDDWMTPTLISVVEGSNQITGNFPGSGNCPLFYTLRVPEGLEVSAINILEYDDSNPSSHAGSAFVIQRGTTLTKSPRELNQDFALPINHVLFSSADIGQTDFLTNLTNAEELQSVPTLVEGDYAIFLNETKPRINSFTIDFFATPTAPTTQDTDGDGALDTLERATGFQAFDANSTPPVTGAVGINFFSEREVLDDRWPAYEVSGYLPQINWNQVESNFGSVDESNVTLPSAGAIVDDSGAVTNIKIAGTFQLARSNYRQGRQPERLFSSYIAPGKVSTEVFVDVDLTVSDIPFADYDVYLYPSAKNSLSADPVITVNKGQANEDVRQVFPHLTTNELSFVPESRIREGAPQRANVLKYSFSNQTSFTVNMPSGGIAGLQIVPRPASQPANEIPDAWVLIHGAQAQDPAGDPDGDDLSNLAEFQRGTDPNKADSDGDGLSDLVETNTGIYVDLTDTGTDPNYPDSDEDGMGDDEELFAFNPSNPNKADSDDDGLSDEVERDNELSALDGSVSSYPLPQEITPTRFRWTQETLHFLWDHERSTSGNRTFFNIRLINRAGDDQRGVDLTMALLLNNGNVIPSLFARASGAFTDFGAALSVSGETDLKSALGFSGWGSADLSDPITMEILLEKVGDVWSLAFTLRNEKSDTEIFRATETNLTLHPTLLNGTANFDFVVKKNGGFPRHVTTPEVRFYRGGAALETLPKYIDELDENNDGLPDAWADRFSVTDAGMDRDGDGLSNYVEYLIGTSPRRIDSDGDRVSDAEELAAFGDPRNRRDLPFGNNLGGISGGDFDGNGLSDLWEKRFAPFSSLSPSADPDGDGFSNLEESIAGTDPFDALSYVSLLFENMGENLRLTWPSFPDKRTALSSSETLQNDFDTIMGATNGIEMPFDTSQKFFRLEVSDQDLDGDGLTDAEEAFLGTNSLDQNSAGRPISLDLTLNGTPDVEYSGDYAYFLDRYRNNADLADGSPGSNTLTPREAARFLMQTTFGPRTSDINEMRRIGIEEWIEQQINEVPMTKTQGIIDELYLQLETSARQQEGIYHVPMPGQKSWFIWAENIGTAFARAAVQGDDQLRQRIAFALAQIFVISDKNFAVEENIRSMANFHDLLADHAFGNFYDLLKGVSRHPMMGVYLSSLGNQKADLSINRFPDENYAREVMQLFSIGVHEMNLDGTFKRGAENVLIETYTQGDVSEMARVMTGLILRDGSVNVFGGYGLGDMRMNPGRHDFGEKVLFGGDLVIPAKAETAANAEADLDEALLFLFNHENCPPFISKSLIKFLITDNPSPAYVERVAQVFLDDGTGTRGNLEAVWKAILLDPEARDASLADSTPEYGRLRDPVVRYMHLYRLLRMDRLSDLYWWESSEQFSIAMGQFPMNAITVFNFYKPDYQPPGSLKDEGFFGGPFEILDTSTSVAFPNLIWRTINDGNPIGNGGDRFQNVPVYDEFLPFADDNEALVDHLNLVVCGGLMEPKTRAAILSRLNDPYFANGQNTVEKITIALYAAFICPEGAVQK